MVTTKNAHISLNRRKGKKAIREIIAHIVLIAIGFSFLFPFLWMLLTALKSATNNYSSFLLNGSNYPDALTYFPFFTNIRNTLMLCI